VEAMKQALMLDPANHAHWNALGVAAAYNGWPLLFLLAIIFDTHLWINEWMNDYKLL